MATKSRAKSGYDCIHAPRGTQSLQSRIEDRHGKDAISEAERRLCAKCIRQQNHLCYLLPLCLDGTDCPYFTVLSEQPSE